MVLYQIDCIVLVRLSSFYTGPKIFPVYRRCDLKGFGAAMVFQLQHKVTHLLLKSQQQKYASLFLSCRMFASYEGRAIADEELIKKSDDWAIEETNFCLGRFPRHTYFPETSDLARRTLMIIEGQRQKMFTRLRDGTVIPVMSQVIYNIFDSPDTLWNYFEKPIMKHTWDETYDDAWEEEEPEFEQHELPEEDKHRDPSFTESDLVRRASGGS